jgi:hypothetical protein
VQPGRPVTASNSAGGARDARLTGPQSEWGLRCAMVATISYTDGPLPLAKRRLGDAVAALADPQPVVIASVYRWQTPIYLELRHALNGSKTYRTGVQRSLLPCRVDVLALVIDIDRTSTGWLPDGKGGTLGRLHQLAGKAWRPQDCDLLAGYTDRLECWVLTAAELLRPTARVFLVDTPCPCCGARSAYVRNADGERARQPALKVSEDGAVCGACKARWNPGQFGLLARLLGCPPLPT